MIYTIIFVFGVYVMSADQKFQRTNITLDAELVSEGLKITGLKTRRELVDFALRELLRRENQKKILELKGRIAWEGNLEEMREQRFE
jgi:Arc/MetJ family transcription regulator